MGKERRTMRRAMALGAAAVFLIGPFQQAARAGTRAGTRETRSYSVSGAEVEVGLLTCPDGVVSGSPQVGFGLNAPTVFFKVPTAARGVSFSIVDQSGSSVMAYVWHGGRPVGGFCRATAKPFRLSGRGRLWVSLFDAVTTSEGPSIVTTGTVKASFSR